MAVQQTTRGQVIGDCIATALQGHEAVESVWLDDTTTMPVVYVITIPIDDFAERELISRLLAVMDGLPGTVFLPHLLNPNFFMPDTNLRQELPTSAVPVIVSV